MAELDVEDVLGLVFDVDDTLTTRGLLTAEAFEALWTMRRAGLRLVAVTGRPLGWADAMAASWPIEAAVGENGAGWSFRAHGAIACGYYDDEAARAEQAALLAEVRALAGESFPDIRLASDQPARRCDLAFDVGERDRVEAARIDELAGAIEATGARALVSSVHLHVIAGAWDKPRGTARAARDALGVELDPARWVFVGDSGNDASAFAWFERSVGVANVREHAHRIPTLPRYVTRAERGAGFAELAEHLAGKPGG